MFDNNLKWPKHPIIYEIDTWPWLHELSEINNLPITLNNVPADILDKELSFFDAIWFMGVWERSPASKKIALEHPDLQSGYHKALHDFSDRDVVGSPYSVYYYHVDNNIGGIDGLKKIRKRLSERNIKLILDYVPNHVSVDSLWTFEQNLFIKGTTEDLMSHPYDYFSISDKIFAYGRDPNFPAWTDTIQINAFSQEARQKTINTLLNIAELCDGVRCDMAMLMTNKIFNRTWGKKAGSLPKREFWEEVIPAVKDKFPNFLFIAEVYWDMEWELQQQGFDFCYDKRLYERLMHESAEKIKDHLRAEWNFQRKLLRFIENHDEQRVITAFGKEKSKAAAILTLTLPGARLIHEGQIRGYKLKLPVQLGRRQIEEDDQEISAFYLKLLKTLPGRKMREGTWLLCKVEPSGDFSNTNLITFVWQNEENYFLIVVNFSPYLAKGNVRIKNLNYGLTEWSFTDLLTQNVFVYEGEHLDAHGLYIELPAWNGHIFDLQKMD